MGSIGFPKARARAALALVILTGSALVTGCGGDGSDDAAKSDKVTTTAAKSTTEQETTTTTAPPGAPAQDLAKLNDLSKDESITIGDVTITPVADQSGNFDVETAGGATVTVQPEGGDSTTCGAARWDESNASQDPPDVAESVVSALMLGSGTVLDVSKIVEVTGDGFEPEEGDFRLFVLPPADGSANAGTDAGVLVVVGIDEQLVVTCVPTHIDPIIQALSGTDASVLDS